MQYISYQTIQNLKYEKQFYPSVNERYVFTNEMWGKRYCVNFFLL